MELSGQLNAPAAFPHGKKPPLPGEETGLAPEPVGHGGQETYAPVGNRTQILRSFSPSSRHYTD
jgi:hypothetical protein